ncbi:scaffoldin [Piromyces finnis]|uniref:Scaffoldin n=1 Tax=Piromyces finnis TaxID=1754191 RepID=A0A1Y1UYT3_9FUNG|nr:scaffoldin [Piromyces finnis]|eukprot:ORX42976.1 scaffoldin [Piromyces finnis]
MVVYHLYKRLIFLNLIVFKKVIADNDIIQCTYSSNKCQLDRTVDDLDENFLCYSSATKNFYKVNNESHQPDENNLFTCTLQNFSNNNIFISERYNLLNKTDTAILAGFKCYQDNSCDRITNENLYYYSIVNPKYYIYAEKNSRDILEYKKFEAIKHAVYYLNESSIILCKDFCSVSTYPNGFYIDSENKKNVIQCLQEVDSSSVSHSGGRKITKCQRKASSNMQYYINSGPDKSSSPLIYCDDTICTPISNQGNNYYLNAGGQQQQQDLLIYCINSSCSSIKPGDQQYYVGLKKTDTILIFCNNNTCSQITQVDKGFYKNSGSDFRVNPLIYCSSSTHCLTKSIDEPGYYMDASDSDHSIFSCKDTCNSIPISSITSFNIPGTCYTNNNYIIMVGDYNENEHDHDHLYSTGDDLFYYLEIERNSKFPSITSASVIKTLFRVSPVSITRVVRDGILSVNDNSHILNLNSTSLSNETSFYECNKTKMICEKKNSCKTKSYYLDMINRTGFKCEGDKLDVIDSGYYLDAASLNMNGMYHHLIYCINKNNCISITEPLNYYINGGSRYPSSSSTESLSNGSSNESLADFLIYCSTYGCSIAEKVDSSGYYIAGGSDTYSNTINNGCIYCKSTNECELKKPLSESYYINSGIDKSRKALIRCQNGACQSVATTIGYFISGNPEELIYCENVSSCSTIKASAGFYYTSEYGNEEAKKIIECKAKVTVSCEKINAEKGYYISNISNVLINCMGRKCVTFKTYNGIFHSATTITTTTNYKRNTKVVYNIITCSITGCSQLSAVELAAVPICTFDKNKCYITTKYSPSNINTVNSVSAGGYCTNLDHSIIYFATDTIVIDSDVIDGISSIYATTTTTTNCLDISGGYSSNYYVINNNIFRIDDGCILQETNSGYYFINVKTNSLVSGKTIEEYNHPDVKVFKCNDNACLQMDKPESTTYYTDVNKKIIQYNVDSDTYVFPYEKDITCIYENNKCTPNADLNDKEFCITYKGELVLAGENIKSRETGDCFKSNNIISNTFGYSQHLYEMNSNAAQIVDATGYYIVSLATNSTATYKDYNNKNNKIKIYGCKKSQCKEYQPLEDIYYYDYSSRHLYKYAHGEWTTPQTSGYVFASTMPNDLYVYKFSTTMNKVTLEGKAVSGYYYTVDNEMYDCDENNGCEKISDNGYYFTNHGEIYYCLYDSEGLEKTTCVKQNCSTGQYYYIDGTYYRCESGSIYNYISAKYCHYNEKITVNFPTAMNSEYPQEINNAIRKIAKNNNSTAIINSKVKNYLTVIPGIFTNCTYNSEDKTTKFDLVCINNYVTLDEEDNAQICSISQLGYVECIDDENNKGKCNPSFAYSRYTSNITFIFILTIISYFLYENIY